ncbi:MAG: beta strand repeat-containing protein [Calditrichia bacterium]
MGRLSILLLLLPFWAVAQDHLLISEVVVTPTIGEYVEIHNPTASAIDLTDYYLTDATFATNSAYYYNIVTGADAGGGTFGDWLARFPAGASIPAGAYQTIAMNGADFQTAYGQSPTYELFDVSSAADMLEGLPGSVNSQGGLTNSGEVAILFQWDGVSDLVADVDYVVWGDKVEGVDKTGVSIDGPDADSDVSTYLDDVSIANQIATSGGQPHNDGESIQRFAATETDEITSGGNGITGNNEMSENLGSSFITAVVTPNAGPPASDAPQINNVMRSPANPSTEDVVTITATVTDDVSLVSTRLFTSIAGAAFDSTDMANTSGDEFSAMIPIQAEGVEVQYFIKARDGDNLTSLSATTAYTVIAPLQVVPIADIQANPGNFTTVLVEAIVTVGAGRLITTRTDTYVQDASGRGINVFSFDEPTVPPNDLLVRGNAVRVTGTVEEFNGITEITNYTIEVTSTGNAVPDALVLTTQAAGNTALEGTLIETSGSITDISAFADAANITIDDGSGSVTVRVWATTGIDVTGLAVNDEITVRAVMDLFNDTAQLVPAYNDDLQVAGQNPGDGSGSASITPDSVATSEATSAMVSINGEGMFSLESVSVRVPQSWSWTNSVGDVQLAGSGFSGATVDVLGSVISISGASVTDLSAGTITINSLTAPATDETSEFQVRTATAGGTLISISASPKIIVGAGGLPSTPIADIQANPSGFSTVTIQGVVTQGAGVTIGTRTDAYVQDASGRGINVFSFDEPTIPPNDLLVRGNVLRLTGTIEEFNGVTELTNYSAELVSTGNPIVDPLVISTQIAGDVTLEGTYVQVTGIVNDIVPGLGGGTNIDLNDGSGEVTIRVWDATNINLAFISQDDTITVRGVIDIFDNDTQVSPGYQDEITIFGSGSAGDGSGFASISPDTASIDAALDVTLKIWGNLSDTLETAKITVPYNWAWSGQESAVTVTGSGAAGASVQILREFDELFVEISGAAITGQDTAYVAISGLTAPDLSVYSYFWIRTASAGGTPFFIAESPRIQVGNEPIHQMRDIQTYSAQFTGDVTLRGVVTIADNVIRTDRTSAYFQDFSGFGININDGQAPGGRFPRGAGIEITGGISVFGETTQIAPSTVTSITGLPDITPISLSSGDAASPRYDGTLIEVSGVVVDKFTTSSIPPLDFNVVLNDGTGELTARIWSTTGINLDSINVNDAAIISGIGDVFVNNSGVRSYQVVPGYQDQLALDPNFQPTLAGVSLSTPPNPFVPTLGETIDISYNAGSVANRTVVRIFDLGGRLVTTLLDEEASLIQNVLEWDGRDRFFNRVPLGAYICHLEVVEPVTGKKEQRTAPIVVGTVLSR